MDHTFSCLSVDTIVALTVAQDAAAPMARESHMLRRTWPRVRTRAVDRLVLVMLNGIRVCIPGAAVGANVTAAARVAVACCRVSCLCMPSGCCGPAFRTRLCTTTVETTTAHAAKRGSAVVTLYILLSVCLLADYSTVCPPPSLATNWSSTDQYFCS